MHESAQKPSYQMDKGKITDLNLVIANMKMSGMTGREIAKDLNISDAAVSQHLKRFRNLVEVDADGAINDSRTRLTQRLNKFEKVIDYAVRPKQYRKSATYLGIAKDVSLNLLKGLGVLVERTEQVTEINLLAQQREDVQARIQAAKQFGLDVSKELPTVQVKVVENSGETADKQRDSDTQAVVPDDSPVDVSRETSAQPDILPTTDNTDQ